MYKLMMLPLMGLLTAGVAMAQETNAPATNVANHQARMEARMDKLAAKLGLDAQGKATVESTFTRYRSQMKPVWQDMKQTRASLESELAGAKDANKLSSLTAQLTGDRQKLASLRQAQMSELQKELTPAQYAQFVVSRHEGRGRFGHGHGRFHGGQHEGGGEGQERSVTITQDHPAPSSHSRRRRFFLAKLPRNQMLGWHKLGMLTTVLAIGCSAGTTASGGSIQLTASGEVLALDGYAFPPAAGDTDFVDGWEVRFTKVIAVFDKVTLAENPDTAPTDQSQTGKIVAELDGPWAIDLHKGGPLQGKGGSNEEAFPIASLTSQNKNGNAPFDTSVRYALSFDTVAATASAKLLQISAGDADYAEMVANGWTVLYVGTATWKGGTSCTSTGPAGYDFSAIPTTVNFRFGFATPTSYLNCQNPDNDPAKGVGSEEHERGVQAKPNAETIAQLTFHTDHPFWESFTHDSPAHFDQLASLAVKQPDGSFLVTLDAAKGVDYHAFQDPAGNPLPWRACDASYTPPSTSAQMGFDSLDIDENPKGDPAHVMRDYQDFLRYDQSTQGHLNSDGLCFVQRHYASPL
jgi:Spy/CpxP family protein refolding chaperone